MRHWVLLICPAFVGCLGCGYPHIAHTPRVAIDAPDVHAFRVTREFWQSGPVICGPIMLGNKIEAIPVTRDVVDSQHNNSFSYFYLIFPFEGGHARSVELWLYRPGYEMVVLSERRWWQHLPNGQPEPVVWKPATDLAARKAAVDQLVSGFSGPDKATLEFAASEYTRLAGSLPADTPQMKTTQSEWLALAKKCSERAALENR